MRAPALTPEQRSVLYRMRRGRKLLSSVFGGAYFIADSSRVNERTVRALLQKGLIVKTNLPNGTSAYLLAVAQ